jgi:hypothetical protein
VVQSVHPPRSARAEARRAARGVALGLAGLVAAGVLAVVFVLPWAVRRACIGTAAAHGISLAIQDVHIDRLGFQLLDVAASLPAVGGARGTAQQVDVDLAFEAGWLRPHAVTVWGADTQVQGSAASVAEQLARWRAAPGEGSGGGEWLPATLVFEGSRVVWKDVVSRILVDAAGVHLDVAPREALGPAHATSKHVMVQAPFGSLGPWQIDADRVPTATRLRLALDPAAPDATSILLVGSDQAITSVEAAIAPTPLERLGVPAGALGLRGPAPSASLAGHYSALRPDRMSLDLAMGLYGLDPFGLGRPLDVVLQAAANSNSRGAVELTAGKLSAGPLAGALRAKIDSLPDGLRVSATWSAGPVPCASFKAPPAKPGNPSDLALELSQLAQAVGLDEVTGNVSATGALTFDTRDLAATSLRFTPQISCKLAALGSR